MATTAQTPNEQTSQILGNPFISVPVTFKVEQTSGGFRLTHTFIDTTKRASDDGDYVPGSIVVNPDVIGASAQVVASEGSVDGIPSQRLLIKTVSPQAPAQRRTLDMYPVMKAGRFAALEDGSNMYLKVSNELLPPGVAAKANEDLPPLPLIVGPDSVAMGYIAPEQLAKLEAAGVNWGGLFDIAKRVVPVVAKAGYQVYQELTKDGGERAHRKDGSPMFLGALLSIAQMAVPIAGTLISAITGK